MSEISLTVSETMAQLIEDAQLINKSFISGVPDPSEIRAVISPILRRQIVDQCFFQIQKHLNGKQIMFDHLSIKGSRKTLRGTKEGSWMGCMTFSHAGISFSSGGIELGQSERVTSKAKDFFSQTVLYVNGKAYKRSEVVKLYANNLGGTHASLHRKYDRHLRQTFGLEVKSSENNIQMMLGPSILEAKKDLKRRPFIYDASDIIVQDTALTFSRSVLNHQNLIRDAIDQLAE